MARKGLFGELYYGEGEYVHDVKDMHRFPDGSPTWRATWQVGLRGCTYGTHSLGPVMRWFKAADPRERIETVSCFGSGVHTDPERPHDDTCLMICQLASGKLVKVRLDMMSNRPHRMQTYELQGTRGVYESGRGDGEPGRIWIGENRYEANRAWTPISAFCDHLPPEYRDPDESSRAAGHGGGDYYVIQAWLRSIRSGGPPPIGIDDALEWTAAGLCSQESILQGGLPVKVPRFG
jgi:predicted dehydrogenase